MNIYQLMNQLLDVIEEQLEDKIDYQKLSKILGASEYTMRRFFSLLCNIPLSEYIRMRRLSNAGYDLYNGKKIIDVALKYQYESTASFSRAFEKFHGMKPSQVKRNPSGLKIYSKLVFQEKTIENPLIEYNIIEKNAFTLYGVMKETKEMTISKDAPAFCQECRSLYGPIDYGMVVYENRFYSEKLEYWVLYQKNISGLKPYTIPKSKWLVFRIHSRESKDIQKMSRLFYTSFIMSSKYKIRPMPELEYYHDDITDFLVPIEE